MSFIQSKLDHFFQSFQRLLVAAQKNPFELDIACRVCQIQVVENVKLGMIFNSCSGDMMSFQVANLLLLFDIIRKGAESL